MRKPWVRSRRKRCVLRQPILTRHVTFFFFSFLQKWLSLSLLLFSPHLISPSLNQTHDLHGRSFKAQHKPPTPLPWPKLHSLTHSCRREPPLGWPHFPLPPTPCEQQPPPPPQNPLNHHHHNLENHTKLISNTNPYETHKPMTQNQPPTDGKPTKPSKTATQTTTAHACRRPLHHHRAHLRFDWKKPTEMAWSTAWPTTTTTVWSMVLAWSFKKNEEERKKKNERGRE